MHTQYPVTGAPNDDPVITGDVAQIPDQGLCGGIRPPDVNPKFATVPDGITTKRVARKITPRRAAWVDVWRCAGITDDGRTFWPRTTSAGILLDDLPDDVRVVYLVGERPGGTADGFHEWRHADTWGEAGDGHYLESLMFPVLHYERNGRRVDVQRAAAWFGEGDYTVDQARDAWRIAGRLIGNVFDGAGLLATPATTGRDLWLRSIPWGVEWPVLTDEIQELVRTTSGQGRTELRTTSHGLLLPGLAEYDGRLMYGALCWGLGAGRPQRGTGEPPNWRPQTRGRFRCSWTVPASWSHVGLLPTLDGDVWRWPDQPGENGSGWIDGAELALARAQGWAVTVHEWLTFDGDGDPLRTWADKIVGAWDACSNVDHDRAVIELARRALRAVVLHGIGAFAGRPSTVTRSCPLDQPGMIPAGAVMPRVDGDRWVWGEKRPAKNPELAHPEWSAAVWARCRVRLLDAPTGRKEHRAGALHLPAGVEVVAMRTDALYLTGRVRWPDDGKVGRLRLKAWQEGPLPAPSSLPAFLALRARGR